MSRADINKLMVDYLSKDLTVPLGSCTEPNDDIGENAHSSSNLKKGVVQRVSQQIKEEMKTKETAE